jgi:hypothetical protein
LLNTLVHCDGDVGRATKALMPGDSPDNSISEVEYFGGDSENETTEWKLAVPAFKYPETEEHELLGILATYGETYRQPLRL